MGTRLPPAGPIEGDPWCIPSGPCYTFLLQGGVQCFPPPRLFPVKEKNYFTSETTAETTPSAVLIVPDTTPSAVLTVPETMPPDPLLLA